MNHHGSTIITIVIINIRNKKHTYINIKPKSHEVKKSSRIYSNKFILIKRKRRLTSAVERNERE